MAKKNNLSEITKRIKENKKGTTFSKAEFNEVALGMLNTDHVVDVVKKRNEGSVETIPVNVTKGFIDGTIKPILKDMGVDDHEISRLDDGDYEFKKADGVYEFASELVTTYMETGKNFKFLPKEDLAGTISLGEVDPGVKDYIVPNKFNEDGTKVFTTIEQELHRVIKASSKCPDNKKKKIK